MRADQARPPAATQNAPGSAGLSSQRASEDTREMYLELDSGAAR